MGVIFLTIKFAPILNNIFIIFLLLISLYSFEFRHFHLFNMQFAQSDIILAVMMLILSPLLFKKPAVKSVKMTINMFSFIIAYAVISMLWVSGYNGGYGYIIYQLLLTSVTVLIPYLMSKTTIDKHINFDKAISNFSIILTLIFLYYNFKVQQGARLDGHLGGAAIIHSIMIPVLAVHWYNVMKRKRFIVSIVCLFITMACIFLTSSRAGLISLVLFILVTIFRRLTLKRFIVVSVISSGCIYAILQFASTVRYNQGFNDNLRSIAIDTGIAWATHSPWSFIFGNGYGSIWEWAAFDNGYLPFWTFPLNYTEYGPLLFHAHSVFIQLFAELGVIGTIPFIIILFVLIKEFWKSNKRRNELSANILGALVCTIPSLHTDLFFFRNWAVSIVWLFFLFCGLYNTYEGGNEELSLKK